MSGVQCTVAWEVLICAENVTAVKESESKIISLIHQLFAISAHSPDRPQLLAVSPGCEIKRT